MSKEKNTFPMLSIKVWHKLRQQFKKKIPSTLTNGYLASILDINEGSARTNVLAPLKILGFVEDGNKANKDRIVEFRDDSKYPKFCEKLIKEIYPDELTDAFPDDESDKSKIQNWFMSTGLGQAAAKKATSFYHELLVANPDKEIKSSRSKAKSPITKQKTSTEPKSQKKVTETTESNKTSLEGLSKQFNSKSNMTINLNIQLTVPETTDEEVYDKFFQSLKKHLLS